MRGNTLTVFTGWQLGKRVRRLESLWTDGTNIYSYKTPILIRRGGGLLFNETKYSMTTTIHQNGLRLLLGKFALDYASVNGVPMGIKAWSVLDRVPTSEARQAEARPDSSRVLTR